MISEMTTTAKDVVAKVAELATQAQQQLQSAKPPQEKYAEKVNQVRADIQNVWRLLEGDRTETPESFRVELQEKIIEYGGALRDLQVDFEATRAEEQGAYDALQEKVLQNLVNSLVAALGVRRVENSLHSLAIASGSATTPDNVSPPSPAQEGPKAESVIHISSSDTEAETENEIISKKRTRGGADISGAGEAKKRRHSEKKRTVAYEEVWQSGKAPVKHIIVEYPDESNTWYILCCEEHNMIFKDNPLLGAAKHLSSSRHGLKTRGFAVAIQHLGIEVKGCTKSKADRNNAVTRAALRHNASGDPHASSEAPTESSQGPQTRRNRMNRVEVTADTREDIAESDGIIDPTPGEVYLGFWQKSKDWLPLLVLPTGDADPDIGISATLKELELLDNMPPCYVYDKRMKKLRWAKGYEDGGPLISKREFPVMYFDGLKFPEKSAVGWVSASDLQEFDPDEASSLVSNIKQVRQFLKERKQMRLYEFPDDEIHVECSTDDGSPEVEEPSKPTATNSGSSNLTGSAVSHRTRETSIDSHEELEEYIAGLPDELDISNEQEGHTPSIIIGDCPSASEINSTNDLPSKDSTTARKVTEEHEQVIEDAPSGDPTKDNTSALSKQPISYSTYTDYGADNISMITGDLPKANSGVAPVIDIQMQDISNDSDERRRIEGNPHNQPNGNSVPQNGELIEPTEAAGLQNRSWGQTNGGSSSRSDLASNIGAGFEQPDNSLRSMAYASLQHAEAITTDIPRPAPGPASNPTNIETPQAAAQTASSVSSFDGNPTTSGSRAGNQNNGTGGWRSLNSPWGHDRVVSETPQNSSPIISTAADFELHPHHPRGQHSTTFGTSSPPHGISSRSSVSATGSNSNLQGSGSSGTTIPSISNIVDPPVASSSPNLAGRRANTASAQDARFPLEHGFPVFKISLELWKRLNANQNRYPDAPGRNCFRNQQGIFICPLCPRWRELQTVDDFKLHLDSH